MKPIKRRHKCTYCGVATVDNHAEPPHSCDYCGQPDFESKVITVVDYYSEPDKDEDPFGDIDWSQFNGGD